jgi:hypothetical protein
VNFDELEFDDHSTDAAMDYCRWLLQRRSCQTVNNHLSALFIYARFCRREGLLPTELKALSTFRSEENSSTRTEYVHIIKDWYIWACSEYKWTAFSEDYVLVLQKWKTPRQAPYLKIRQAEPDVGPLHPTEDKVVKYALNNSKLDERVMFNLTGKQIRCFASLLRTTGIRPQQATFIKRSDYRAWTRNGRTVALLKIPRAKNGERPRSEFRSVRLTSSMARLVQEAIYEIPTSAGDDPWLFSRLQPCPKQLSHGWAEEAWRVKTIDQAMVQWALKGGLVSPITGQLIRLTPKRIRYTYATELAPKVSPAELSAALDHVDVRSIAHYYTYAADFFERLSTIDGAKRWGGIAKTFLGLVDPDPEKSGGPVASPAELADELTEVLQLGHCGSQKLCRLFGGISGI